MTQKSDERAAGEHMRTQNIFEGETVRVERAFLAGVSHEREKYRELVEAAKQLREHFAKIAGARLTGRDVGAIISINKALARLQDLEDGG